MYKLLENTEKISIVKNYANDIVKKVKGTLFIEDEITVKSSVITEDADELLLIDEITDVIEIDYNFLVLDDNKDNSADIRCSIESALTNFLPKDINVTSYPAVTQTSVIEIENIKFIIKIGVIIFDQIYYQLIVNGTTKKHAFWFPIPNSTGYIDHILEAKEFTEDYSKIKEFYLKGKNEYKDDLDCPYQAAFCYILAVNNVTRGLISQGKVKAY